MYVLKVLREFSLVISHIASPHLPLGSTRKTCRKSAPKFLRTTALPLAFLPVFTNEDAH
jgi:hypothetical protein